MTPSQSPGPLESDLKALIDGEIEAFGVPSVDLLAGQMLKLARHLDSLSTGKPETGIPVSEQDERLKVAVTALEVLSCKIRNDAAHVAIDALSRIKAMSND